MVIERDARLAQAKKVAAADLEARLAAKRASRQAEAAARRTQAARAASSERDQRLAKAREGREAAVAAREARKAAGVAAQTVRRAAAAKRAEEIAAARSGLPPNASAVSEASAKRLSLFTTKQIANVARRLEEPVADQWPEVDGVLALLFTPRCGSTYLTRELSRRYDIGRVGESLNPPRLKGRTGADVVAACKGAWWGVKLGGQAIIAAELTGVIDRYQDKMTLVFLLRRDIVAQAVSLAKARQMQRFHSTSRGNDAELRYEPEKIGAAVRAIVQTTASYHKLLDMLDRPVHRFHYEDSADGNLGRLEALCDGLGIPRVATRKGRNYAELRPIRNSVNGDWAERFRAEMPRTVAAAIERYQAVL